MVKTMGIVKPSPDVKCRESFIKWAMNNHWIVREDEDIESDPIWQAWKSAWYVCRSASYYEATKKVEKRCAIQSMPIPDDQLKQAWIEIGNGKAFARWVETYHGIKK
jgi:hypothetical protein